MTRSANRLVFISAGLLLVALRWYGLNSPLPSSWTPESRVRYTARILESPELTDSKTIIRQGLWVIICDGYRPLKPGEVYVFVGKIEPRLLGGKVTRIIMVDPTIDIVDQGRAEELTTKEELVILLYLWREKLITKMGDLLPEPHASLAAGILLGAQRELPDDFYNKLLATGTLHVVAASGYNVTVVAAVVMRVLLIFWDRRGAIVAGVAAIAGYVLIAGAGPAVVRAGIMGSLTLLAYYWGRVAEAKWLLWVAVWVMLMVQPLMLVNPGFQLSVAATSGLLYLEPWLRRWVKMVPAGMGNYLFPTAAATLSTLPITIFWFGRATLLGLIVNLLILPVVPLVMLMAVLTLIFPALCLLLYVPLAWMVAMINWWG